MKMKSLAILAISGALAASLAYVAPAMADDTASGQSTQTPSDNNMQNSGSSNSSSGAMPSDNNMNNNAGGNTGSTDEGSPDTATGDDDY